MKDAPPQHLVDAKRGISWLFLVLFLLLTVWLRCSNWNAVFDSNGIYFTDPDCYSRMTRVKAVVASPGLVLRYHNFENFPHGITPHTTSPFDYTVAVLAWVLRGFTPGYLDLAGALVSPLLAVFTALFLFLWARRADLSPWAMLLLFAVSPILVHGTALGRPDHQSLLILCIAIALCAEWILGLAPSKTWALLWGFGWGLGLWVSLYEPLVLLVCSQTAVLAFLRRAYFNQTRLLGWSMMVGIGVLGLLIDGLRWNPPSGDDFNRWAATIGELRPGWRLIFPWVGWWLVPGCLLLALRARTRPWLFLLVGSVLLTGWQARWGYFMALISVICIALPRTMFRRRIMAWVLLVISLWPVARQWDDTLVSREALGMKTVENRLLYQAACAIKGNEGAVLAPWWLSPALTYWSSLPTVAGSSHESLPGIIETARFFSANDPDTARQILRDRRVQWVVASEPESLLENSAAILSSPTHEAPMAKLLFGRPSNASEYLKLRYSNDFFRVYKAQVP